MLAVVSDVHFANHRRCAIPGDKSLGLNSRAQQINCVIHEAMRRAYEARVTDLVFAGDTFDSVRPEPQVIAAMQSHCRVWTGLRRNNRVFFLLGNHEQLSAAVGDHALGPMAACYNTFLVDVDEAVPLWGDKHAVMLPYRPGAIEEWLPDALSSKCIEARANGAKEIVLIGHFGVYDDTFAPWAKASKGAIHVKMLEQLLLGNGVSHAFLGDWHARRTWAFPKATIMQVGALVPTGWDNPGQSGLYGTLALWKGSNAMSFEEIPGPRFLSADWKDGAPLSFVEALPPYLRVKCKAKDAERAREWLDGHRRHVLESEKLPCHGNQLFGEVVIEPEDVAERAERATAPGSIAEALDEYLKTVSCTHKETVHDVCRNMLGVGD